MPEHRDEVVPGEKWVFDGDVADAFDDMLRRSIPDHDEMRGLVDRVARAFLVDVGEAPGAIVDLGCSRGEAVARLAESFPAREVVAVDVSAPMLAAARNRFAEAWPDGRAAPVRVEAVDLRRGYPDLPGGAAVTLVVLTLQFTPIEYRRRIVERIRRSTVPGGGIILVEKVLGSSDWSDDLAVRSYWNDKRAAGYSDEAIARKAASLEGVLVPLSAAWNEDLLRAAGFGDVECFWRRWNFGAWWGRVPPR